MQTDVKQSREIPPARGRCGSGGCPLSSLLGRRTGWILWALLIALLVAMQWPMLKGWYYKHAGGAAPADRIAWRQDLQAALAEGKQSARPVLLVFSASWCPPCQVMKHEVWPDEQVHRAVADGYVPVMLDPDTDAGAPAAQRYQVLGIPTILALDADGRVLRQANYLSRDDMLQFLSHKG